MNKIALGTAQFGLSYGVANIKGQVSVDEVAKILGYAQEKGIDTLDTATAYGNSENVLGAIGVEGWRVITKIPALPPTISDIYTWIMSQVDQSLKRANLNYLDAVMLHKPSDMLGSNNRAYLRAFDRIKSNQLAGAIGYSVYSPEELPQLCSLLWPDIVQVPYNVFDRLIKQSGWLDRLNQRGTRIHVRSIFLQGLLVMPFVVRPSWFLPWNELLCRWDQACLQSEKSPAALAFNFVLNEPGIEKVVVGVESKEQLAQLLNIQIHPIGSELEELACEDVDLIEPYRWNFQ